MWSELLGRTRPPAAGHARDTAPADAQDSLEAEVAQEKLRLIVAQAPRVRLPIVLLDLYIVWLMSRIGAFVPAAILIAVHQAMHVWRWTIPYRHLRDGGSPLRAERRLEVATALIGIERGLIAIPLFAQPVDVTHYICTMILVGQLAGAAGSMAGLTRGFSIWASAMCLPTAIAWVLQGTALTVPIGLLMVLLLVALVGVVRENAATLHKTISLKRQMETFAESLRVERDRAEEANRAKTRFFAAANHDLRQPLQTLRYQVAQLEYLTQKLPVSTQIRDVGENMARSLEDSEKLLEGLLDISKLDAGAMPTRLRSIDARTILGALAAQFGPQAAARGLALEVGGQGLQAAAPPAALWVLTDRDQLMRVLGNLVGNALRFTHTGRIGLSAWRESGREPPRLAIAGADGQDPTADAPRIVFCVEDTGVGIPAQELARVFEEFYQIGNAARQRGQGLGLGLAIVKRLVGKLGGAVALASTPGAGTRFEVALPAAQQPPEDLPSVAASSDQPLQHMDARILVVDDDTELLESMRGMLSLLGCEVRTAEDGHAAMAILDEGFRPEVFLLDHRLRQEKGLALLERLRARLGPVPAVLLTGDTTPELAEGAEDGRFLVQHKPVNPGRLVALIRAAVGVERESEGAG